MTCVLVWIEPLPIRDCFDAFFQHGLFLAEAMAHLRDSGHTYALVSNAPTLRLLAANYPACADALVWPDAEETRYIESLAGPWNADRQAVWSDLARGHGPVADRFCDMAARILRDTKPDVVVAWSDNGALRRAARTAGIPVLHCELGPTRAPFSETLYIDPNGTNGFASVRTLTPPRGVRSSDQKTAQDLLFPHNAPPAPLADMAATRPSGSWMPKGKFALVPLQLADDLNTRLHAPHQTPRAFLQEVLPPLLAAGYAVVVKGHPGAGSRQANVLAEDAALELAESFGMAVSIAPRDWDTATQLACLGSADLVICLNSSVAFEALLVGTPAVLLGHAAFDMNDLLWRAPTQLAQIETVLPEPADTAAMLAFLARHTLHPKSTGQIDLLFARLIESAVELADDAGQIDPADWAGVIDHADPISPPIAPPDAPLATLGYLETISVTDINADQITVSLTGWGVDAGRDLPLTEVRIQVGTHVLAATPYKSSRPDVAAANGLRTATLGFEITAQISKHDWQRAQFVTRNRAGNEQRFWLRYGRLRTPQNAATTVLAPIASHQNGRARSRPERGVLMITHWLAALRDRSGSKAT